MQSRISRIRPALAATALAVVVAPLATPSASASAASPSPVPVSAAAVGAPSAVGVTATAARSGHVVDRANDVTRYDRSVTDVHARTIDINRLGYSFGQQNAKFTVRTRDLRNVANRRTAFAVDVFAYSSAGREQFQIAAVGSRVAVFTANDYRRPCPQASVSRDTARNTVTLRAPLRCLTGRAEASSVQARGLAALFDRDDEMLAVDVTSASPRISLRK